MLIVNLALHILPQDRRQRSCLGKFRSAARGYQVRHDDLGPSVHHDRADQPVTKHYNCEQRKERNNGTSGVIG